ncbi:MAG TPA: pyruvate kinase [Candidatus Paceibacterota bacterium]|nr:pyruvate kinase [Candidatus Paceibacterota bacterium]
MEVSHKAKTKIVATLGPNSAETAVIEQMLRAGLSVARINMSHGDHETHAKVIKNARTAAKRTKLPLAILQDLSGPKIRIGDFETETVTLVAGEPFVLTTVPCVGTVGRAYVNYAQLPKEVEKGMTIFLNDGKLKLEVERVAGDEVHTRVIFGGTIRGRRGVNIPDAQLSIATITPKDKKDLAFGIEHHVDFVTLSFVRTADDIYTLRKLIKKATDRRIHIVAKIETKSAIEHLDAIIEATDAVMVARGDLAIEVPPEKVPLLQKEIIRKANNAGKPVITATQMLDSMRTEVTPTRAEVSDIANAILDGTDAVMLSDETAVGAHPVRAIDVMQRVACEVERDPIFSYARTKDTLPRSSTSEAVAHSIVNAATVLNACVVVTLSEHGYSARMVSRFRPHVPILVLTPHESTFNQSLLLYGCIPVRVSAVRKLHDAQKIARKIVTTYNFGKKDDVFVLGAGVPFGTTGTTNMMIIEHV